MSVDVAERRIVQKMRLLFDPCLRGEIVSVESCLLDLLLLGLVLKQSAIDKKR